jgi:hypothetical protein
MGASRNSKSSRTSSRAARGPGAPWKLALALAAVSALAALYFLREGNLLWYGDAAAHLNIARRILDGRSPGYEQIGTVWLPLPHLLMLAPARIDALWRSGLAGALPSMVCFVAAALLLYGAARRVYGASEAAAAAALLFALNPNMLYLQALPMTEAVFAASAAMALYGSLRGSGAATGLGLLCAAMTRYEGWFLIPFAAGYLFWRDRRAGLTAAAIAAIGPAYWLAHNWIFMGDPLEFYRGTGSAKWIYQQALNRGMARYPGDGDWIVAAQYYWAAGRLFAGTPLVVLGALGIVAALAKRVLWPLAFLALSPAFYVWSMHGSGTPIFLPNLWPNTYYNSRYGMAVLPLAAFAAAAFVAWLPERWRRAGAAAVVLVGISQWIAYPNRQSWVTWKESEVNSAARRAWTHEAAEFLKPRYERGTGIVMHFGDQIEILREAGLPVKECVHDGDGLYFQALLRRPDLFLWQEWVIAISGDQVSSAMAANEHKIPRYRRVKIVTVKGASPIEIWRRSAS